MKELIDRFDVYLRTEAGLAQETVRAYLYDVHEFSDFHNSPDSFNGQMVSDWLKHLAGLKNTTLQRKCMSVRAFYNFLAAINVIDAQIVKTIDPVRVDRSEPLCLTEDCMVKLIDFIADDQKFRIKTNRGRNIAIILLLYDSGLRVSELCAIDVHDLNLLKGEVRVHGKGSKERVVPITKRCNHAIGAYMKIRPGGMDDSALFIAPHTKKRITRRAVTDMITSTALKAIGTADVTAHTLRHSCATNLYKQGVELEDIRRLLGHEHLTATERYVSVSPKHVKQTYDSCHPFGKGNS
jgi:site-specific recombinase XerD